MLKSRVFSGVIYVLMVLIFAFSGPAVLGIGVFAISVMGMQEYFNAISVAGYKPIRFIGYVSCLPILALGLEGTIRPMSAFVDFISINLLSFSLFSVIVLFFCIIIFLHDRHNIVDAALTTFGIFYVVYLFSFLILTRNLEGGFWYLAIIFIGSWLTDTCAFFVGINFGKTKFLPAISAKKSLEGSIGGLVGCVLSLMLLGWLLNRYYYPQPVWMIHYVILGLIIGVIAQIGDWAASAIKRNVGIKDFGNLLPGHGGILDRFDSILFVAPVVYFYARFFLIS